MKLTPPTPVSLRRAPVAAVVLLVLCTAVAAAALASSPRRPAAVAAVPAAPAPATEPLPTPRAAPTRPQIVRDLRYGPAPAQTLDVHLPPTIAGKSGRPWSSTDHRVPRFAGAPAVLLVHGGGWFAGDKLRMAPTAAALAAAGFVVFNVNYTLATRDRPGFPGQLRELRDAVGWIAANGRRYGADPARLGVLGSSAGGNLAALLALDAPPRLPAAATRRGRAARTAPIAAVVTWSAPLDLPPLLATPLRGPIATFTGCRRAACRPRLAEASPRAHIGAGDPPMLLVNSRRELVPARQATRMAAALAAARVPHELLLLPGALHGRELAPRALAPTVAFLRRTL